jgi:hypothetical protein
MSEATVACSASTRAVLACLAMVVGAALLVGCGSGSSPNAPESGDFEVDPVWKLIEHQVDVGQRPAGSPQLKKLATELRPMLPGGHFEPIPGEPNLHNIVGTLPGREPAIVVGAHYDTLVKPRGFVGANNGASGTALVIEIARTLQRLEAGPHARKVDFVLFDGEEPAGERPDAAPHFYREGLRGSRAYAAAHHGRTADMILLDYVGGKNLNLPREQSSNPGLWSRVLGAAAVVGTSRYFSSSTGVGVFDDHSPFLREGVPAVDLIDWNYPGHSLEDGLDLLSRSSLSAVGETIVQLVDELRNE